MSEHDEQAAFVFEVLCRYGNCSDFLRPLFFSVPNGAWLGGRNPFALMAKYKAEGFTPGVSDILYLQPRGGYAYLAIEMKATNRMVEKDKGISLEQAEFQKAVIRAGGRALVCYGAEAAVEEFIEYMKLEVP